MVSLTTDGWTSRATESYITTTAHFIDANWTSQEKVLETITSAESHKGKNLGDAIRNTSETWKTVQAHNINPVTTDNASNMTVAVESSGLGPHITCFAHTLNLSTKQGLQVASFERLFGTVRRIVNFFHRSPKATSILKDKVQLLDLNKGKPKGKGPEKLLIDVSTR